MIIRTLLTTAAIALFVLGWMPLNLHGAAKETSAETFRNDEIEVPFNEQVRILNGDFTPAAEGYFLKVVQQVRFCQWQERPGHIQSVGPGSDGYLCNFYVLPPLSEKAATGKIQRTFKKKSPVSLLTEPEAMQIGWFRLLKWRYAIGKTRLDHYLVFGKKYNYLFVSWPYGSNGSIEKIIGGMRPREQVLEQK